MPDRVIPVPAIQPADPPTTTTLLPRPLGLRVRDVREHRGLGYREAAAEIGMAVGALHRLENDGTLDLRLSSYERVVAWLLEHGPAPLASDRLPDVGPYVEDDRPIGEQIREADAAFAAARERLDAVVGRARDRRVTWREIGDALGVSRQAAHERFQGV